MLYKLGEMTWPEVKERIQGPHALVLTVAATEEAGSHMPLNFDTVMFNHMIEKAAEKVMMEHPEITIFVAPPIPYGEVSHVSEYPGSIGVTDATLIAFISDIMRSAINQGFKNFVNFLGHMQNRAAIEIACRKIHNEFKDKKDLGIYALNPICPQISPLADDVKAGLPGVGHAGEVSTSEMLAIAPELVHMDRVVIGKTHVPILKEYLGETGLNKDIIFYNTCTENHDEESGMGTDPSEASKEFGQKLLKNAANVIADILVQITKHNK